MNMDELKTAWKEYDRKIQSTRAINEKIITSMITERSVSRFSKVRRQYVLGFTWMLVCLTAGITVILTNPFDYMMTIQYIPMVIFSVCLTILLAGMAKAYYDMQNVTMNQSNIENSLRKIIGVYEKPKKFMNYTVVVFLFSQLVLFPLSFLPRSVDRMGFWPAIAERLIPISTAGLMLFIAYKLGAFKEHHKDKFRKDLTELEELKAMAGELINGN